MVNCSVNDRTELFRKIQSGIDGWLDTSDASVLHSIRDEMMDYWWQLADYLNDYRPGCDTYGYKSKESVRADMEYISDRWGTASRLKWIIDGLDNGSFDGRN